MGYTTFVYDKEKGPGALNIMDLELERARASGGQLYILGIRSENGTTPNDTQKLKEIQGVRCVMRIIYTVQLIVQGDHSLAERIADELHKTTGNRVGVVKDDGRRGAEKVYQKIYQALDIAQKSNKPWHLYDPAVDSIEAILAKAREK